MNRALNTKTGFSLIEITLALLVIGLGLLAVFGLFGSGLQMNSQSQQETSAALFAQQVMAGAASAKWADLKNGVELSTINTSTGVRGSSAFAGGETVAIILDGELCRYSLKRDAIEHQSLLYCGEIHAVGTLKSVTLYLWYNAYVSPTGRPGSFDPAPDATFYRDFFNFD